MAVGAGPLETMVKILLTGGTGYLGSQLRGYWGKKGHKVFVVTRNSQLLQQDPNTYLSPQAENWSQRNFDILCLGHTDYGRKISEKEIFETNLIWSQKLVETLQKESSLPVLHLDTSLHPQISPYSQSKMQLREWLKDRPKTLSLRLEHFFDEQAPSTNFVIWMIQQLLLKVERIPLTGGEQEREFIYTPDIVKAVDLSVEKLLYGIELEEIYRVNTGESSTLKNFCEKLKYMTGNTNTTLGFGDRPYRPFELENMAPVEPTLHQLGWKVEFPLDLAIKKVIDFLQRSSQ